MRIMSMNIKRTSMSIIALLLCYHIVLIHATNDTDPYPDQHSNQTTVEIPEVYTTISNITEEIDVTNAPVIQHEQATVNVTEDTLTTFVTFNETTPPPIVSTEVTTATPPPLNVSTVVSTTEKKAVELNTTQEYVPTTTEYNYENQTIEVVNGSCSSFKFGCCDDRVTERTGPNNEGCNEINETTVTMVTHFVNVTDTEVYEQDKDTATTSLEISTKETTSIANVTFPTSSSDNETNVTTTVEIVQQTSTELATELTTIEEVETTTEEMTTVAVPKTCADTEHECCPDGVTTAKGPKFEGCNTTETWMPSGRNVSLQTVCEIEKDPGTCSKYVNMWSYDRQQGKCIRFWYGGCEGNGNRFETEQQCQETCVNPKGIEVCLLPKITGPCHSNTERYYYDREKKECQQFHYGGCNGNGNNFDTLEKCQSFCEQESVDQCTQSVEPGSCKGDYTRYYYDTTTGQCRTFVYGGCQKNQNHFLTLKDCLQTCVIPRERDICLLPKVVGTCQERRPTWYFDMVEQECKLFHYSGCKGNYNRFSTKEECDLSCASLKVSKTLKDDRKALCRLPMVRGDCDQQIARWYYNPLDEFCHSFQYTGCHGNANAFETEQDCRESCEAKERDICTLDKDSGSCDQYKIMWYYDSMSKQCKNFYYGSCGGNANRFVTEQECQLRCLIKAGNSTCSQQVDPGHACNNTNQTQTTNSLMKFFFDQQLKKCSSFLYQGCGGNDNRFDEESKCVETCVTQTPTVEQGCGSNMIRCNIQCRFGFERDSNGCEICRCFEPCQRQQCPSGYTCMIIPEQVPCLQAPCPVPRVECQPSNPDQSVSAGGGIKPLIENSITNIFSQFDANVTIPCNLRQGYPQPVIYWYKERQQLQVHEAMSNGIIVRKIERLPDQSLLIRKITLEDQGLYTCRAINDYGQDIKDVQLEIFDPIKVDIYPINRVYQLGFTAKLQCRATGYPLPRVIWMRDHVPLMNSSRLTLQNDGSLIIHPYKPEDAGPYVCNATNKKESVTQVAYLEVKETRVEQTCEDQPTFANCELVLRHNFCDVYFDYCCRTCSQHGSAPVASDKSSIRNRRHVFVR